MTVELYPDHKAILYFQDSLKVYEIDFLDDLTKFLTHDTFNERHFNIYVKPTLSHSAFDFIIVESNRAIYLFQTPENTDQIYQSADTYSYFLSQRLHSLSQSLHRRIQHVKKDKQKDKAIAVVKQVVYLFQNDLINELSDDMEKERTIITRSDFKNRSEQLLHIFESRDRNDYLTDIETKEIKQTLNPNTNIQNYIQKSIPRDYEEKTKSLAQSKQKFKGPDNSGKTLLLTKRIINCANRLKGSGRILVIAGNISKVNILKDIITAEDGRSLQELGIEVSSFQELAPPKEKYLALFIDDGHYLKTEWYNYLLNYYLVEMTDDNNYEYVVMADEENLPHVPKIHGPFRTLKYDINHIHKMLSDSREIFLSILGN